MLEIDTTPMEPLILAIVVITANHIAEGDFLAEAVQSGVFAILSSILIIIFLIGASGVIIGNPVCLMPSDVRV